jgi:tellurite resistance protein TerC
VPVPQDIEGRIVALWIGFTALVILLLALDLGAFHRQAHVITVGEALVWSGVWIGLAMLFNVFLYFAYEYHWFGLHLPGPEPDGRAAAVYFFTGYIVEKSLSVDNLFVIALIFSYFSVPPVYQHRVLYWGILGALVMRGVMILAGAALIERFDWVLYVFGAFLIWTAIKMLFAPKAPDQRKNFLVNLTRRIFSVTNDYDGPRFVVRRDGRLMLTPLALALIAVESADVVFAVDSIPAIFAITLDPFIVFTSNVFAILGLRSLYFALADIMGRFHYMKGSLAVLLVVIGLKMLFKDVLHDVPGLTYYTLGAVAAVLAAGIIGSLLWARRKPEAALQESVADPDARNAQDHDQ